jgi:hypothetical protein
LELLWRVLRSARLGFVLAAIAPGAHGQTDEIQVYDAEIAEPGVFNLMVHTNFTPIGRTVPEFPNAIVANDSVNGAAEWAYGVKPWFEQGLYLPVYSFIREIMTQRSTVSRFVSYLFGRTRRITNSFTG